MKDHYTDSKVAEFNAMPGIDNGVVIGIRFEQPVNVTGTQHVFPLDEEQFISFFKILHGIVAERGLEQMRQRNIIIPRGSQKIITSG